MNITPHNDFDRNSSASDAEKTLRLIATLPAPRGLEDRVKSGLQSAPRQSPVVEWPFRSQEGAQWMHGKAMRAAAAAAIVFAVAGGGWEVYSHIQIAPLPTAIAAPQHLDGKSGFSQAGAVRKPQTLEGPVLVSPVKEKTAAANGGKVPLKPGKRLPAKVKSQVPVVR